MPLRLLLDENISPVIAEQVKKQRPEIGIESVHRWRGGAFLNQEDRQILLAAASEGLTLVTYDQSTIPSLLDLFLEEGQFHAGVIYVARGTIANHDFGLLIRALIDLWMSEHALDWNDRTYHLRKPKR